MCTCTLRRSLQIWGKLGGVAWNYLKTVFANAKCSFFSLDIAYRSLDAICVGQELFCISSLEICSNFTFFCLAVGVFQMCNARRFHMWSREGITLCQFDGNHFDSLETDCGTGTKNSRGRFNTVCPVICCETFILILIKLRTRCERISSI